MTSVGRRASGVGRQGWTVGRRASGVGRQVHGPLPRGLFWPRGRVREGAYTAALSVLLALHPAVAAPTVDDIVRKVQARYDATTDFTADVTQEATIASLNKTVTARGTVCFKKPGKMRWEFTQGDPQIVVADGSTLWIYRPEDRQVLKMPFARAFESTTPLSFLTGVGQIKDDFVATFDGEKDGLLQLTLVPRRDNAQVGRLRLTVGRDSFDIRGAEIVDPLGNVSRLQFDKIQRNVGVSDERFVFEPPAGVDVLSTPRAP